MQGERATPRGDGEPVAVANWLQIEDARITRVRVTFDLGKLLQAGGDPRRRSAHHRTYTLTEFSSR